MNKPIKTIAVALAAIASMSVQQTEACTRATYIGPDNTVITGRTMDWKEDIMSNIYVFPRGMKRAGYNKGETVNWTSKYGSVIATGYDIGTCDGINEKGLVASLLFLPESVYSLPGDTRPVMGISIWTQYVLDNFATVHEAVEELKKETSTIILYEAPHRLVRTLEELKEALGNRKMTLCRELTKKHEPAFHTTIEDLISFYQTEKPLGECVLVIQGRSRQEMEEEQKASWEKVTIEEHMEIYENQGHSRKEAMKLVANDRGVTKRDIYQYLINK